MSLNGAARYSDYNSSGGIWSYNGGVVYAPLTAKGAETLKVCKLYRFYNLVGSDALFVEDRRYARLAEQMLFAKTAADAEPAVLAMREMIREAKDGA